MADSKDVPPASPPVVSILFTWNPRGPKIGWHYKTTLRNGASAEFHLPDVAETSSPETLFSRVNVASPPRNLDDYELEHGKHRALWTRKPGR